LTACSVEYLSGRFGPCFKKAPDWYRKTAAEAIERRFFALRDG
jgi:hypothetical protein